MSFNTYRDAVASMVDMQVRTANLRDELPAGALPAVLVPRSREVAAVPVETTVAEQVPAIALNQTVERPEL